MVERAEEIYQALVDAGISEDEISHQVKEKDTEFQGFMTKQAILFLIATIVISPLPYYFKLFNEIYLLVALGGVDSIMIISIILLIRKPDSSENAHFVKRILKFGMFIGLFSFLLGFPGLLLPDPNPFRNINLMVI